MVETTGEMMWYAGQGVYKDGFKVSSFDTAELIELLISHGYIVIREDNEEED